jgi:hypothetical protein
MCRHVYMYRFYVSRYVYVSTDVYIYIYVFVYIYICILKTIPRLSEIFIHPWVIGIKWYQETIGLSCQDMGNLPSSYRRAFLLCPRYILTTLPWYPYGSFIIPMFIEIGELRWGVCSAGTSRRTGSWSWIFTKTPQIGIRNEILKGYSPPIPAISRGAHQGIPKKNKRETEQKQERTCAQPLYGEPELSHICQTRSLWQVWKLFGVCWTLCSAGLKWCKYKKLVLTWFGYQNKRKDISQFKQEINKLKKQKMM